MLERYSTYLINDSPASAHSRTAIFISNLRLNKTDAVKQLFFAHNLDSS
nr:MAG TPA: hypothetical protein [Caudoviricetes sp.]